MDLTARREHEILIFLQTLQKWMASVPMRTTRAGLVILYPQPYPNELHRVDYPGFEALFHLGPNLKRQKPYDAQSSSNEKFDSEEPW
jgi:hypothetical protein